MGTDRFRNTKDDCMSGCRSFGSNGYPCSQSRKISIGILVDSSTGSRSKKQDDVTAPAERVSGKVNITTNTSNGDGVEDVVKGKKTVTPTHQTSPWVSTRPTHQLKPSSEVFGSDLPTAVPASGGTSHKSNGVKAVPETHSVKFYPKQTSILQSGDLKKERVGASSLTARYETSAPARDAIEEKTNETNDTRETLRTKLWDVLGTLSSPKRQASQAPEAGVNNSILEDIDKEGEPGSKPRSNSDTIETSSECPHHEIKRPVTRSLAKKRAPNKVKKNSTKNVPPSTFTRKHQENTFSLKQGLSQRLDASVIDGFPKSFSKKRVRKGIAVEAQTGACSPTMDNADEIHVETDMHKTTKCAMTSALGKIGQLRSFRLRTKDFEQPENEMSKKDAFQPTAKKILEPVNNVNESANGQHRNKLEDFPKSPVKKTVNPYLHSPTSETRTPSKSFSGSLQRTSDGEQDDHVPAHSSPGSPLASKSYHQERDMGMESSADLKDIDNSPLAQSESITEEKDEADKLERSLSKGRDTMSTKDGSPMSEGRRSESPFPQIAVARESRFMHYGSDRSQSQGDIKVNSPISTSQKGSDERFQGLPDQEDALANAVTLFAAALEKVANKIKMVTSKRTSEVLTSVSKEIYVQLQNAESQMQKDMGKVTSFTKSKRKRIEAAFVEQEEQLKLIYRRFRADVDQHLQECRSTVEGFEAQEMEFKGFMEKRRASQRKLLKQVEEAIETQLSDAERRITAVHKSARAKMVELKYSIAECLKVDG